MEDIVKADIFFLVTTIVVILVGIVTVVGGYYVITIAKDLQLLVRKAREEGEEIIEDIKGLREQARLQENPVRSLVRFLFSLSSAKKVKGKLRSRRKAKTLEEDDLPES